MKDYKKLFVARFNGFSHKHNRYQVFSDFVDMAAAALRNAVDFSQEVEDHYLRIVKRYSREELNGMTEMFAFVVEQNRGAFSFQVQLGGSQAPL